MRRVWPSGVLIASGSVLLCLAGGVSSDVIEEVLVGQPSGILAWGPTLFRILLAAHGTLLVVAAGVRLTRPSPIPVAAPTVAWAPQTGMRVWLVLGLLSLVAIVLRLWRLGSCLWVDEVLTLLDFVRSPVGQILTSFHSQNQHMLYSLLAHASIAVFGESAWALRLPSVAFGIASIWALFLLARCVVGEREALLTCALATLSYHHVWFSQNARGYMGLMFFTTLATWLWLEAVLRRTWTWWLSYAVAVTLGMWTHLTMVFVPASHALLYAGSAGHALANRRAFATTPLFKPMVAWVLASTLTLQFYALSLPQFLRTALHQVSVPSEWTHPVWMIRETLRGLTLGFGMTAAVICGGLVAAAGFLALLRNNRPAAMSMVLPPLLAGATLFGSGHNLWPRFFFFSMGFALLLVVHGTMTVSRVLFSRVKSLQPHPSAADAAALVLTCLLIVGAGLSLPRCYALPKQDFTGARGYVERSREPDDAVVAVGLAGVMYSRYFAPHWSVAQTPQALDAIHRARRRVWLVYTLPIQLKASLPGIWEIVEREFEVVAVFPGTLGGGEVRVCRERQNRRAPAAPGRQA